MAQASPKSPTTKEFVDIVEIRESVAILKNGSMRSIIEVTSVNFDLKSPDEQTALIQGFQNFINYVDFPLQIVVSSRKLNINPYLASIEALQQTTTNELLKIQIYEYSRFVKGLADLGNIMSKKFYITIPYYAELQASSKGILGAITGLFSKPTSNGKSNLSDADFQTRKAQLDQRIAVISSLVSGLGLEPRVIQADELKALFYTYYNPGKILE